MNKYGTYVRGKLSKIGLTVGDYDIMKNPFEHVFVFEEGKGNVSVDSAYSILPLKAKADLKKFLDNFYTVEPKSCHKTACHVGKLLEKYGVIVCNGYYKRKDSNLWYKHSFCKYQDKYFDSTIETLWGEKELQSFEYESVREFNPSEFWLYCNACGYNESNILGMVFYDSSLGYNQRNNADEEPEYVIDNNGYLLKVA